MKVLHIGKFYPPHRGGMETHVETLCREIKSAVNVEVLVSSDDAREVVEVLDGVTIRRLPTWFKLASAPVGPGLVSAIRSSAADIVHLHFPHPTAVLAWLASGHRGRLIITYHSDIVRQKVLGTAFRPFLRAALRRASVVIGCSPNYVESSEVLREFRDRCVMIPYGVCAEDFAHPDRSEVDRIRAQAGPRVVLAVGRLVAYKGFAYLIQAMARIDARLILVGDGPLRGSLETEAYRYGVRGKVIFVERADDLVPYYHAADVFVLPSISRAEAFGLVQMEAMACGRPVVNTTLDSGVPFVSIDGLSGLSVPPCDSEALASAVNRLLGDANLRGQFGKAAQERVARDFTVEAMGRRTVELYERVAVRPNLV